MISVITKRILNESGADVVVKIHGDENISKSDIIVEEVKATIFDQLFFWSDTRLLHYMFDYKLPCGVWAENITINNCLSEICVNIY